MDLDLDSLDALCSNLDRATKTIKDISQRKQNGVGPLETASTGTSSLFNVSSDNIDDMSAAKKNLSSVLVRLQTLVGGPNSFLQQLATQTQLLACIKWLGEYQVIACIPLTGNVSIEELAQLADVPEVMLSRVVRMIATAGFLCEPEPGLVAHTPLSSAFSTDLSYFDAAMYLSNQVAPSALHLTSGLQKQDDLASLGFDDMSSSSGFASSHSINALYNGSPEGPQLNRQCLAYRDSICGSEEDSLTDLFRQLNWQSLGDATVVYACSKYTRDTSQALQQISRTLRVVVQTPDLHASHGECDNTSRIKVHCRKPSDPQPVKDAAVYIVRPPLSTIATNGDTIHNLLMAELYSHVHVLRSNPSALLIVAPTLLPEPGSVDVNIEVQARLRDFSHLQLQNEGALEVSELARLIANVSDQNGKLVATNRLRSTNGATIALAAQYQPFQLLGMST